MGKRESHVSTNCCGCKANDSGYGFGGRGECAGDVLDCGLRCEDAGVRCGGADEQFGSWRERAVCAGGRWCSGFAIRNKSALWAACVGAAGARDWSGGGDEEDFGGGREFLWRRN